MSIKSEIFSALKDDAEILKIVGNSSSRITDNFPSENLFSNCKEHFPRITFGLTNRKHVLFTDNEPFKDEVIMTFYIWLLPTNLISLTLSQATKELTRVLRTIGYTKTGTEETYNIDQKVYFTTVSYMKDNVDSNL